MAHKPVGLTRSSWRVVKPRFEDRAPTTRQRRQMVLSVNNTDRLAVESCRARPNTQPLHPEPPPKSTRDFAAYFLTSSKTNAPTYALTSHTCPQPMPQIRQTVPTFPMTQSLRWNPHVETSSLSDFQSEKEEEPKFNCKCEKCSTKRCPSKVSSSCTIKPTTNHFKDNIAKFNNQCTMTLRLNDASCGCTPTSSRFSDVSVMASEIAVRDTQARTYIHQLHDDDQKHPAPILKKNMCSSGTWCDDVYAPTPAGRHKVFEDALKTFRDEDYPFKTNSIRSFFRRKQPKDLVGVPRRNIYNEGICDVVANYPTVAVPNRASPTKVSKDYSRGSMKSRCSVHEGSHIPYSHKADSKYHHCCKKSQSKIYYEDNELPIRESVRKATCKPLGHYRCPPIRLPKRVLTSERDIESFIKPSSPKLQMPTWKPV